MHKEPSWRAKAMYIVFAFALVFGIGAAVLTVQQSEAQLSLELVPGLAMNVKTASETFTVMQDGTPVPGAWVSNWKAMRGEGTGDVDMGPDCVDGSANCTVTMVVQGDAIVTCDVDVPGVPTTYLLNAEKKWGEIVETYLLADPTSGIDVGDQVIVEETVIASFLPGPVDAPAGGAMVNWWLLNNDDLDEAQSALEDLIERFGPDNYSYTSGPTGEGSGCGQYSSWGWEPPFGDPTFIPKELIENGVDGIYDLYPAIATTFTKADGVAAAGLPATKYVTYTGIDGTTDMEVTFADAGGDTAEPVIVVVLADYPLDKNGENAVCVEYIKFTPRPPAVIEQVKTPQVRWAGEKLVLEKDWGERSSISYTWFDEFSGEMDIEMYVALYSREGESIGNLEPIEDAMGLYVDTGGPGSEIYFIGWDEMGLSTGADQVIAPLGDFGAAIVIPPPPPMGNFTYYGDSISRCILVSEQQGQVDVNAGLFVVNIHAYWSMMGLDVMAYTIGPVDNHGFLVYYLAFEDVLLTDEDLGALMDVTPEESLIRVDPVEDTPVAVQVRGYFTSDRLGPAFDPDTGWIRAAKAVDTNNDGNDDTILPEGRWILPDDWWAMANFNFPESPNWDLMDQAHQDGIVSPYDATAHADGVLGPFNTAVRTTAHAGAAQEPSIGPFNTLQPWSIEQMWDASAVVDSSGFEYRNTVVPDGIMSWHDCPMPQALVRFDIVDFSPVTVDAGLAELEKGNLEGYGYSAGTPVLYNSPFYAVEIPSHWAIPDGGYDWKSWDMGHPYAYWWDLMKPTLIWTGTAWVLDGEPDVNNDQDVETYCDNHGIAALNVSALGRPGNVVLVATASYPDASLKGKYGPMSSDDITVTTGAPECNPDFEGDPRFCPQVEGCIVTFQNLTDGCVHPYQEMRWDFNGDGEIETTLVNPTGDLAGEAAVMVNAPWDYSQEGWGPGVYRVCLSVLDDAGDVTTQCQDNYITVGEGVVPTVTLHMEWGTDTHNPAVYNIETYTGETVSLATLTAPDCLIAVYAPDPVVGILYYFPSELIPDTLTELEKDTGYLVVVSEPCDWDIPQPE